MNFSFHRKSIWSLTLSIIVALLFAASLGAPASAMSTKATKGASAATRSAKATTMITTDMLTRASREKTAETGPDGNDWGHCWYFSSPYQYTQCDNYDDNGNVTRECTWDWDENTQAYGNPFGSNC
jgi:hypothetical protein